MINIVQTKICDVSDSDFQLMITELCECVYLDRDEIFNQPLSYLLMVIAKEEKVMSLNNILVSRILEERVGKLSLDSIVYLACCELVRLNGSHIEFFSGRKVFTVIKNATNFLLRGCPMADVRNLLAGNITTNQTLN
jgi:hypothetical protein